MIHDGRGSSRWLHLPHARSRGIRADSCDLTAATAAERKGCVDKHPRLLEQELCEIDHDIVISQFGEVDPSGELP
jgi:hypothetical protein